MTLRGLHRLSASMIGAFALVHVVNHLVSLAGVQTHVAFMDAARSVYRLLPVEVLLLFCVGFQVASGLWLVVRGWKQRTGLVAWLQAASGAYLALFLLIHVSAVLLGRLVLGLDTNFHFAAAGFHVPPYQVFFGPYYFLAVFALFSHLGCAAYWQLQSRSVLVRTLAVALPASLGAVISLLIGLALAGHLTPVEIPASYKATYSRDIR